MEKIIKHYQTLLPCEQFVVTGSLAMSYMGLVDRKDVGDIDIILVNPTEESINILKRLAADQPAKTKAPEYKGESMFIFQHEETKIDIFILKTPIETKMKVEGFWISPLQRILQSKKEHNRPKDWIQMMKISRKIFNEKEFDTYVQNFK